MKSMLLTKRPFAIGLLAFSLLYGCHKSAEKSTKPEVSMNPSIKPELDRAHDAVPPGPDADQKRVIIQVLPDEAAAKAQVILYGKKVAGPLLMSTQMTTRIVVECEGYRTFDEYVTPPKEGNTLVVQLRKGG